MNSEELNKLRDEAYSTAKEHGFHDGDKDGVRCKYLIGLVISELGECINADRHGKHANLYEYQIWVKHIEARPNVYKNELLIKNKKLNFELNIKDTVEDEFSDIIIRLLDFAGACHEKLYYLPYPYAREMADKSIPEIMFNITKYITNIGVYSYPYVVNVICNIGIGLFGEDIWAYVKLKMWYNKLRPIHNGKLY